jgi:predicted lysophospholipase L1 biosynthesis ABC-type transport system permease subunit
MVLFFAGVIACSVIYNVTAVSLAERQRELASLRVLGLSAQEVGGIIYNENFVLSVCGILLGIPMGQALCAGIVTAYSNDLFRLPFYIQPKSYALAAIFTLFFVNPANLLVRRPHPKPRPCRGVLKNVTKPTARKKFNFKRAVQLAALVLVVAFGAYYMRPRPIPVAMGSPAKR